MRRPPSFSRTPGLPSGALPSTVSTGSLRAECIAVRRQSASSKRDGDAECSWAAVRSFVAAQIGNEEDRAALLQALPGILVLAAGSYVLATLLGVRPMVLFGGLALGLALPRIWDALCFVCLATLHVLSGLLRCCGLTILCRAAPPKSPRSSLRRPSQGQLYNRSYSRTALDTESLTYDAFGKPVAQKPTCTQWLRRAVGGKQYHVAAPAEAKESMHPGKPAPAWGNHGRDLAAVVQPRLRSIGRRVGAFVPTSPLARMCLTGLLFIVIVEEQVLLKPQEMAKTGPPRGHAMITNPLELMPAGASAHAAAPVSGVNAPVFTTTVGTSAGDDALAEALRQQELLEQRLQQSQAVHRKAEEQRAKDEREASALLQAALAEQKKQLLETTERIEAARRDAERRIAEATALATKKAASTAAPAKPSPPQPATPAVVTPKVTPVAPVEPAVEPPQEPPAVAVAPVTPPKPEPVAPPATATTSTVTAPAATSAAPKATSTSSANVLQANPDGEKPVLPRSKCWNGCPFGYNDKNLHIVWTTMQQRPNTRGIMGGPRLAEAKLRDLIALSVPSMKANHDNGWRGAWLVYYDDDANANYPPGYVERLKAAVDALPFAAALPAAIKGSGDGQRYMATGGSKCMQHTKQLRKAIKDGYFSTISPAPTDKTYGVSKTVTMTSLEAGDAFATKFLVDIQQKAFNFENGLTNGKWPPAGEEWPPAGGVPDGGPLEPALVLCAFNYVYWFPNAGSPDAKEGFISEQVAEKKCVGTGLTVHQRRTDTIASYLVQRHKFKPKVKFYMGMEGRYQDLAVVVKTLDDPETVPPRSTSIEMLHAFLDNTLSHEDVEAAASWRLAHGDEIVQECKVGAEEFKACDSWQTTA